MHTPNELLSLGDLENSAAMKKVPSFLPDPFPLRRFFFPLSVLRVGGAFAKGFA